MSDEETKKPEAKPEAEKAEKAEKPEKKPKPEKKAKEPEEGKPAKAEGEGEAPLSLEALAADEKKRVDPKQLKAERQQKKAKVQEETGAVPPEKAKTKAKKGKEKKSGEADPFVKRAAAPRLRQRYVNEIVPALMKEFGYGTKMAVPRMVKITLNMGLGQALQNAKLLEAAETELTAIAGQKPVITKARKSIATFKLRQGQKIGCMVTLRRDRMYEFFDRLVSFALPRTRDFKGISPRSFDGRGNFSIGIREQIIFPEIDYDKIEKIMGLNISIVTTARTDEEGRALLKHLGMPFR
jgi:large subunit ribosomal protein L5